MLGSAIAIAMVKFCKVARFLGFSEFPSRERGTDSSLENRSGEKERESDYTIVLYFFWFIVDYWTFYSTNPHLHLGGLAEYKKFVFQPREWCSVAINKF